jgi:hypothetical protein
MGIEIMQLFRNWLLALAILAAAAPAHAGTVTVEITGNGTGTFDSTNFQTEPETVDFHLVGTDSGSGNTVTLTTAQVTIGGNPFTFTYPMQIGLDLTNNFVFFGNAGGTDLLKLIFTAAQMTDLNTSKSFSGSPNGINILFAGVPTSGGSLSFTGFDSVNLTANSTSSGDPTTTPLPAALPLFASGLSALGLLGWRRKRKAAAIAA